MLLSDMTGWDFLSANWLAITTAIGGAIAACATAFAFCIRAFWFYVAIPVANYVMGKADNMERVNVELTEELKSSSRKNSEVMEKMGGTIEKIAQNATENSQRLTSLEQKFKCNYRDGGS